MSSHAIFVADSRRTYNKEPITSLDDYLSHVERLMEIWDAPNIWFRGLNSAEYALIPGIYRRKFAPYDHITATDMANEFIRKGIAFLPDSTHTKWHWYHVMQHYGLPTRLLDWTVGAFIGLYFALRDQGNSAQPCVWVLNPYWLNSISTGLEVVFFSDEVSQDLDDRSIADQYLFDSKELSKFPIAISPPHINERITAQKSTFTVHGALKTGMHRLWKDNDGKQLAQLRISRSSSQSMLSQLWLSGLTESTLFPDLEGLSLELIREYGFA